jgi:hypothetical protein
MSEGAIVWLVLLALAAASWALYTRRRKSGGDGEWGALVACAKCGRRVPRWFMMEKNSPRGPISFYRYPIPTICRICRQGKGLTPVAWQEGESEAAYNVRSEQFVAETIGGRLR